VNRIARELGLVPSTALHILRALMAEQFVAFDDATKRYQLDIGVLTLAGNAVRRDSFIRSVQPGLDRLSEKFGLTMLASKIMGLEHAVVVAISPSALPFRLYTEVGSRFPALISASGRCVAACGSHTRRDLQKRFKQLKWARPLPFAEWLEQVEEARRLGYGIDRGNFLAGVTVVAVPVMESGQMTHTIVAVGLHEQLANQGIDRVAREIQAFVAGMANDFG